jgi:hypothetical protein
MQISYESSHHIYYGTHDGMSIIIHVSIGVKMIMIIPFGPDSHPFWPTWGVGARFRGARHIHSDHVLFHMWSLWINRCEHCESIDVIIARRVHSDHLSLHMPLCDERSPQGGIPYFPCQRCPVWRVPKQMPMPIYTQLGDRLGSGQQEGKVK